MIFLCYYNKRKTSKHTRIIREFKKKKLVISTTTMLEVDEDLFRPTPELVLHSLIIIIRWDNENVRDVAKAWYG